MALTALHGERGRLDATQDDLGCGWAWTGIHRVRPRVPLTCPECGHGLHAKVSPGGMRFFAHDRGAPACALAQESMEHHLLKLQLATEVRAAGWFAELEVRAEDGSWRADVMASSPVGDRRMAWEAQLSPITADAVRERTERFARHGVAVCWVATRPRPWVGSVPSVRVTPPDPPERVPAERVPAERVPDEHQSPEQGRATWEVTTGLARFSLEPCERWCRCELPHGVWEGAPVALADFVAWVLTGRVVLHRPPSEGHRLHDDQRWWGVHWTAPRYAATAAEHDRAELERRARAEQRDREEQATLARIQAAEQARLAERARHAGLVQQVADWRNRLPMFRRWRVEDAATQWAAAATGGAGALVDHRAYDDLRWAGGLPVRVGGVVVALLRPDPRLLDWARIAGTVVLTADRPEHELTVACAPAGAAIVSLADWLPPPARTTLSARSLERTR